MSEEQSRDFSKYDAMTTQALEEILRLYISAPEEEESDTELLLYVMGVLADRRRNTNSTGKTALEAWESFQRDYLCEEEDCSEQTPKKDAKGAVWRRLIAAAAVVVLLICVPVTAGAFGWGNLWHSFARWAKETFSFVSGESAQVSEPDTVHRGEASSLKELLEASKRDASVVPTWIPEGFSLEKIEKDITPAQEIYRARYLDGDKNLEIRIQSYVREDAGKIEVNENLTEVYKSSDVDYYIITNNEKIQAIWLKDSYECYIAGDLTIEELKLMIDSIGKG